ncbi:MAG: hypothetical protein QM323_11585 [Acidobacteriota bacterium]|nr:hypothetical protein [Acidobacteriota bacterium]
MHAESIPPDRGAQYAALIKPGDAVTTPDDEVWVVLETFPGALRVIAAARGEDGFFYVDPYEQTETVLPRELVSKVADARKVRRS